MNQNKIEIIMGDGSETPAAVKQAVERKIAEMPRSLKSYKIEYKWEHRDGTKGGSSYTVQAETESEAIRRGKAAFERDFDRGYKAWFQDGSEITT